MMKAVQTYVIDIQSTNKSNDSLDKPEKGLKKLESELEKLNKFKVNLNVVDKTVNAIQRVSEKIKSITSKPVEIILKAIDLVSKPVKLMLETTDRESMRVLDKIDFKAKLLAYNLKRLIGALELQGLGTDQHSVTTNIQPNMLEKKSEGEKSTRIITNTANNNITNNYSTIERHLANTNGPSNKLSNGELKENKVSSILNIIEDVVNTGVNISQVADNAKKLLEKKLEKTSVSVPKSSEIPAKGLGGIAKSLGSKGVGAVTKVLGVVANPLVGVAIAGAGAIFEYHEERKQKLEEERRSLMALDESYETFSQRSTPVFETKGLIDKYNELSVYILQNKNNEDKVSEAKQKQVEIQQTLMNMYPEIFQNQEVELGNTNKQIEKIKELSSEQMKDIKNKASARTIESGKSLEKELKELPELEEKNKKQSQYVDMKQHDINILQRMQMRKDESIERGVKFTITDEEFEVVNKMKNSSFRDKAQMEKKFQNTSILKDTISNEKQGLAGAEKKQVEFSEKIDGTKVRIEEQKKNIELYAASSFEKMPEQMQAIARNYYSVNTSDSERKIFNEFSKFLSGESAELNKYLPKDEWSTTKYNYLVESSKLNSVDTKETSQININKDTIANVKNDSNIITSGKNVVSQPQEITNIQKVSQAKINNYQNHVQSPDKTSVNPNNNYSAESNTIKPVTTTVITVPVTITGTTLTVESSADNASEILSVISDNLSEIANKISSKVAEVLENNYSNTPIQSQPI